MGKLLYIRADGNRELGMGHLMRCFVIAAAWEEMGGRCIFLVSDAEAVGLVKKNGFLAILLRGNWRNLEEELPELEQLILREKIQRILIDSYYFSSYYMGRLHQLTKVIYFGARSDDVFSVDGVINYDIDGDKTWFQKAYPPARTSLALGSDYFPLREEFRGCQWKFPKEIHRIFVTTGGTDPYHISFELGKQILEKTDFLLTVVAGRFNEDWEGLEQLCKTYPNRMEIHRNISNMAQVICQCDLAVSAGGITLYELASLGIPVVVFSFADNQRAGASWMGEHQLMNYVGDAREIMNIENRIVEEINILAVDCTLRRIQSNQLKKIVDGQGARRIVTFIQGI